LVNTIFEVILDCVELGGDDGLNLLDDFDLGTARLRVFSVFGSLLFNLLDLDGLLFLGAGDVGNSLLVDSLLEGKGVFVLG
jgi:hypothetical protein